MNNPVLPAKQRLVKIVGVDPLIDAAPKHGKTTSTKNLEGPQGTEHPTSSSAAVNPEKLAPEQPAGCSAGNPTFQASSSSQAGAEEQSIGNRPMSLADRMMNIVTGTGSPKILSGLAGRMSSHPRTLPQVSLPSETPCFPPADELGTSPTPWNKW